jgi:AcrR family transcriptional regulator
MKERSPTRQRILEASRQLFNTKGYANTTIAEIASAVDIAEGNLWYHFRAKGDMVVALEEQLRQAVRERRAAYPSGAPAADDYVESLLFAMTQKWDYRFLLRDHLQFAKTRRPIQLDPDMAADFEMMREALERLKKEGLFRRDPSVDLEMLAETLWIVTRYWTEYLQEQEGVDEIGIAEQERGIQHHFTVLLPYLTAAARRSLAAALRRVSSEFTARSMT